MLDNWKKIWESPSPERAEIAKSLLEDNGIQAVILNKKDSSYLFGYCELYVPQPHESNALHILTYDGFIINPDHPNP